MGFAINQRVRVATHRFGPKNSLLQPLGRNWQLGVSESIKFFDYAAKYANKTKNWLGYKLITSPPTPSKKISSDLDD